MYYLRYTGLHATACFMQSTFEAVVLICSLSIAGFMNCAHCAMCNVHNVKSISEYSVQCTMHNVQSSAVHSAQCEE